MTKDTIIRVCPEHKKQVPLIFTFAFPGANYWCPHCGNTMRVPTKDCEKELTETLQKRREANLENTKEFLKAAQMLNSKKPILFGGRSIKPEDLPETEKKRLQEVVDGYEYEGKKK